MLFEIYKKIKKQNKYVGINFMFYYNQRNGLIMKNFYLINIRKYNDDRGCLIPFEYEKNCPFEIKRAFVINDVPNKNISRGKHINIKSKYLIIAIKGQVTIICKNAEQKKTFVLKDNTKALFINNGVYRELLNFSNDTILLCLSDSLYDEKEFV